MTRKKRDTSKKRESILDAAITTFIEHGFERTSMDLIAENADSSKRTVYNHFPSKESLIEEAFTRFLLEAFEAKKIEYRPNSSIEEQLGEFAETKMQVAEDPKNLGLMRVTLGAFITHPHMAKKALSLADSQEDGLVVWLKAAHEDERMKIDNANLAAEVFWSLFSGAFFWPPILMGPVAKSERDKLKKEFIEVFISRYGV